MLTTSTKKELSKANQLDRSFEHWGEIQQLDVQTGMEKSLGDLNKVQGVGEQTELVLPVLQQPVGKKMGAQTVPVDAASLLLAAGLQSQPDLPPGMTSLTRLHVQFHVLDTGLAALLHGLVQLPECSSALAAAVIRTEKASWCTSLPTSLPFFP